MKASEARKITNSYEKSEDVDKFLEVIYARIKKIAQEGKSCLYHPFHGMNPWPGVHQQRAIFKRLRADGYKVVEHPDPDPGYPCSGPYETVEW